MTIQNSSNKTNHNTTVLWVTYLNIVLYALSYQLQTPVEPFLLQKLSQASSERDINRLYGNLQSFFQTLQMMGSPMVGILLDRIGIRYTSTLVFGASATCYAILSQAHDLNMLFFSKLPTILQAAFLVAQATAAVSCPGQASERAAALGRMTTAYTIGATIGPTVGGYLANQGDFYRGAKWAVVGSLMSVALSWAFLPDKHVATNTNSGDDDQNQNATTPQTTQKKKNDDITDSEAPTPHANHSFREQVRQSLSIALRPNLWPLLLVKVLSGVVSSMHSTVMPLVLTQQLQLEPSQLGLTMSSSMMAVAVFGAVGMAPLTRRLGPPTMTYVGLAIRAVMGCVMAAVVTMGMQNFNQNGYFFWEMIPISISTIHLIRMTSMVHALAQHALATGLTTQTTGAVASHEQGSLLGLEHALFSMARIGGPKLGTWLLSTSTDGGNLWPVEVACGMADVLLVVLLVSTAFQTAPLQPKNKNP